jgi:hypothetical protein
MMAITENQYDRLMAAVNDDSGPKHPDSTASIRTNSPSKKLRIKLPAAAVQASSNAPEKANDTKQLKDAGIQATMEEEEGKSPGNESDIGQRPDVNDIHRGMFFLCILEPNINQLSSISGISDRPTTNPFPTGNGLVFPIPGSSRNGTTLKGHGSAPGSPRHFSRS